MVQRGYESSHCNIAKEIKRTEEDVGCSYFFSADPGFTHFGFTYGYFEVHPKEIRVFLDRRRTGSVELLHMDGATEEAMARAVDSFFYKTFSEGELAKALVLIERQWVKCPGANFL